MKKWSDSALFFVSFKEQGGINCYADADESDDLILLAVFFLFACLVFKFQVVG